MSRFMKLSHTLWHCQYHIVWTPKYRLRILEGEVGQEVSSCVRAFSEQKNCEINELNVQKDHVQIPQLMDVFIILDSKVGGRAFVDNQEKGQCGL